MPTTAAATHAQNASPATSPAFVPAQRGRGSTRLLHNTPRRLTAILIVLVTLVFFAGITSFSDSDSRVTSIEDASSQNGRMAIAAFDMYRALSDADAAATATFLPGRDSSSKLTKKYAAGIARSSAAITVLSQEADSDRQASAVAKLATSLPTYTGLVETARTYHRQGMPLGLAYLRDASGLVNKDMLPAINDLQTVSMHKLSDAHEDAAAFPWWPITITVLAAGGLVWAQITLARRTNRVFNTGLAIATITVLVSGGWLLVSWSSAASHMNAARDDGATPLATLSQAHIGAQQARSDEALTLIAQGADTDYEAELSTIMDGLIGDSGASGTLGKADVDVNDPKLEGYIDDAISAANNWKTAHAQVRKFDDDGDYSSAVASITSTDKGSSGASYAALNAALSNANDLAAKRFTSQTDAADSALSGTGPGFAILCLIGLFGAAIGMQRRISEYR